MADKNFDPSKPWQGQSQPSAKQVEKSKPVAVAIIFGIVAVLAVLTVIAAMGYHGNNGTVTPSHKQALKSDKNSYSFIVDKQYPIRRAPRNPRTSGNLVSSVVVSRTVFVNEYKLGRNVAVSRKNYARVYYDVVGRTRARGKLSVSAPVLVRIGANKDVAIRGRIVDESRKITNNLWFLFKDKHEVQINCEPVVAIPCEQVLQSFRWK